MGAETANVMRGAVPSTTLKVLMTGVTWFGKLFFFFFPVLLSLLFKKNQSFHSYKLLSTVLVFRIFHFSYHDWTLDKIITCEEKTERRKAIMGGF